MRSSSYYYQSVPVSPPDGMQEEEAEEHEQPEQDFFVLSRDSESSNKSTLLKIVDLYDFELEVSVEDAKTLEQVKERVREQGRLWWSLEASKGVGWYLQPEISSLAPCVSNASNSNHSKLLIPITTVTNTLLLKKLIRKGIPPILRPKVWLVVSGASKKRSAAPDSYFQDLCVAGQGRTSAAVKQIDHDLARTFPSHPWLDSPEGQVSLRNVLVAYSLRDSNVGYCQGMNFVAGLLLLVMRREEEAFWMLAVLLENVLFQDCYTNDLSGSHVEQRVFKDLLNQKCPRLAAHLELIGFDVSLVITEWFLCLFAKSLPSETTLRVWDVLFNEGAKVLFRIALALFKMKEEELLLTQQLFEVISIFQTATRHLFDPDALLKVAFEKLGTMTTHTIAKHRSKQQVAVMEELQQRVKRLNTSS
ncbi:hypothetical protein GOP47_0010692 [Adiantum capillus-veneris]|uniref:Rab-GAP TBC domain-containing protein n=1 Tax=Adiantum capillus-veneris TaxID=13818 RepID=A0A9D4UVK9_ADICA|nr:hypothetical protein GOP47_0010692 [Adiantum capillus-veneris]